MSASRNQPLLFLTSPFGEDTLARQDGTLHAIALDAREHLSRPFEIDLTVVSDIRPIDPDKLLHKPVWVTVHRTDGLDRYFHGLVRRFDSIAAVQRGRWRYQLEVVPRLWFLSQTSDCRIFQQVTATDILRTLFAEHGVKPVRFVINGDQPRREYTTQFNETDLDFVHRLLQESGYCYYFEHSPSGHTLVVTNVNKTFKTMERPEHRVVINGNNVDVFDDWSKSQTTTFGSVGLQDYDPTKPREPVRGQQATTLGAAGAAERDVFRWPAMTVENQVANDRARFRMQAAEAAASLRRGHGYNPRLSPGFCFTLKRDPFTEAEGVDHVVHSTHHHAVDETWIAGGTPSSWDTSFTCFLQSMPWRDELSIPRPSMSGIYSAIVLGDPGKEIHADPLARIKVRPLFDHRKDTVAAMAIWVRSLNAWSGDRSGWQHLPRVGTEVGISFMNGDPDNPVLVGCFYHQEMKPVFEIPGRETRQGFRSRSTPRGGTQQYSELSFDDKKDAELILLHAQRNHRVEVEHDQDVMVGHDRKVVTTRNDSLATVEGGILISSVVGAAAKAAYEKGKEEEERGGPEVDPDTDPDNLVPGTVMIEAPVSITLRVGATSIILTETSIALTTPGAITITAGDAVSTVALADVNTVAVGAVNTIAVVDVNTIAVGVVNTVAVTDVNITAVAAVTIDAIATVSILGGSVNIAAADGAVVCLPLPI